MKPPLERAARALCELAGNPPGATMNGKPLWMDYLPEARAVIEAIREPSNRMVEHAFNHMEANGNHPRFAWEALIDALLAE